MKCYLLQKYILNARKAASLLFEPSLQTDQQISLSGTSSEFCGIFLAPRAISGHRDVYFANT